MTQNQHSVEELYSLINLYFENETEDIQIINEIDIKFKNKMKDILENSDPAYQLAMAAA